MWASIDTEYAPGYSAAAFDSIALGDTYESVISKLGEPLASHETSPYEVWRYSASQLPESADSPSGCWRHTSITFDETGRVKGISGHTAPRVDTIRICNGESCLHLTREDVELLHGQSRDEIRGRFGAPVVLYEYKASRELVYSRSPSDSHYHIRGLGLDADGKVVHIRSSVYWD